MRKPKHPNLWSLVFWIIQLRNPFPKLDTVKWLGRYRLTCSKVMILAYWRQRQIPRTQLWFSRDQDNFQWSQCWFRWWVRYPWSSAFEILYVFPCIQFWSDRCIRESCLFEYHWPSSFLTQKDICWRAVRMTRISRTELSAWDHFLQLLLLLVQLRRL